MTGEPSTSSEALGKLKKRGKEPLRRPRGRRGGVKNRRSELSHTQRIARFHTLEKELARTTDKARVKAIKREQESLGGLEAYQDASLYGGHAQRGGETGKWCAQALAEEVDVERGVRLLDVGALSGSAYAKYKWITTTGIDINPRSQAVLKYDFLDFPVPEERYDVVALSLVINFVGALSDRGRMLIHAHDYLRPEGFLFVALPLACVENSRYMDHERLKAMLGSCGWSVVRQDDSARLTRWLCRETRKSWDGVEWNKQEVRKGAKLNNFCILVRR